MIWKLPKENRMPTPSKEQVLEALREVYDPEIPINVVDLGMIYDIIIEGDKVSVKMSLTAPGCPLAGSITDDVKSHLLRVDGVQEADVQLVWDPPWTPERIDREALNRLFDQRKPAQEPVL
jgi:metal-sulfur cluster biosynthetic enzyme